MERGSNDRVAALVADAEALLLDEKLAEALSLVTDGIRQCDHVRLWRFKKRILMMLGEEEEAAAVMTRIVGLVHAPTPSEFVLVRSDRSCFTVLQSQKLLYLHVPKCGSTTVKDTLYHILKGRRVEGRSHSLMLKEAPYRVIDRSTLPQRYGNWFKFLVVRDPISRLRSYYRFNLAFANDLAGEVGARETYLGLKLQPSYPQFLEHLTRYRQVFRGLRAHTNLVSDIAGTDPSLFDWVGPVKKMPELRARLSDRMGVEIPEIHNFGSKELAAIDPAHELEAALRARFARDYDAYGQYF